MTLNTEAAIEKVDNAADAAKAALEKVAEPVGAVSDTVKEAGEKLTKAAE